MSQPTFPAFRGSFQWGVKDRARLDKAIDEIWATRQVNGGSFAADGLIVWGRNLGILTDEPFVKAWRKHAEQTHEKGIIWRTAVLVWAGRQALRREGAFVECGCYRGTTAHILVDTLKLDRPFYLYDLFEGDARVAMPDHGQDLEDFVRARFADRPNVVVTKGRVPGSLSNAPDKISFLHIDMNDPAPEIAALDALFDRVVPGGVVVFDDFGQLPYRRQFVAEQKWFAARGIPILELPTGQGMVVA